MRRLGRPLHFAGLTGLILILGFWHASRNGYSAIGSFRFPWLLAFLASIVVLSYGLAVPEVGKAGRGARLSLGATLGSISVISTAQLLLGTALLPRSILLASVVAVPLWGALTTSLTEAVNRQQAARDRVVAIVSETEAERLRSDIDKGLERELTLVLTLPPTAVASELEQVLSDSKATILVLGRTAINDDSVVNQAAKLHAAGLRVRPLLGFYEEWVGKLPVTELQRSALLFDISDVHAKSYRRGSRLLDIVISLGAAPVLMLVLPTVLVANVFGNRGPLFFKQSRVGKNGAEFDILKLRSMVPGSASTEWTAEGDARITPVGHLLRISHVDELPQLINILKGEISVVGPRPEQPHYVEQLKESIPYYDLRHVAKPGLTGWAQVNYSYGNTEFDALEKLQFEFYYLRHQSLWLDLRIIARTIQSVIGRKGK